MEVDLLLTDGFTRTELWFDLTSEALTASLLTAVETVLLVPGAPETDAGLPVTSEFDPPDTYPSLLDDAVAGITLLL